MSMGIGYPPLSRVRRRAIRAAELCRTPAKVKPLEAHINCWRRILERRETEAYQVLLAVEAGTLDGQNAAVRTAMDILGEERVARALKRQKNKKKPFRCDAMWRRLPGHYGANQ